MRAIDERFAHWLARVQELLNLSGPPNIKLDPVEARIVFEVFDAPVKPITPEEYARELNCDD